ncbi:MAG: glycosyltransferase family 4 protein [Nitrososphaerota archaeon]|jgi:glycosyltransferase involved in cell wall biosynthesis|nr:glycosyltransferase family 4 protein [Nitrososphaerota archaeon]
MTTRNICFISPEYWPLSGGTGAYVYYLSNELMKNGYNANIVTESNQNIDIQVNNQLMVHFKKIPKIPIIKSFMLAQSSYRKLESIRNITNVDITHPQLPLTPSFAIPPNFGKAIVCTVHSTWKGETEAIRREQYSRLNANEKFLVSFNWVLRFFEIGMIKRASRVIAVSDFTRQELKKYYNIPENRVCVIRNGVDIHKFQPAKDKQKIKTELGFNPNDRIILSVGRLYARKGLFTLIEAIPSVVKQFKNAKFVISGKGQRDEMTKLHAHAKQLHVENHIIFTGYYPDQKLPKLYQAADIFALSTFYEHHPFAVLEALATGLPVVTTTVGGIAETIETGKNGLLVKPFNSKQFSEALLYLLEHTAEATEMGINARKTIVNQYDWSILVKKTMQVYEETLYDI